MMGVYYKATKELYLSLLKGVKIEKRKVQRQLLYRLKKEEMIGFKEQDGITFLYLKKRGREKAISYDLDNMKIKKPEIWDKKWRLVIYDIPERKKLARRVLQAKLNELGFKKLQESIYIIPYNCKEEIFFLRQLYEITPYVQYIEVSFVENEEKILKHFNL